MAHRPLGRFESFSLEVIDARTNRLWGWLEVPTLQLWMLRPGTVSRFIVGDYPAPFIIPGGGPPIPRTWLDVADEFPDEQAQPIRKVGTASPLQGLFVELRMAPWANAGAQPRLVYLFETDTQIRALAKVDGFRLYKPVP